MDLTFLQNEFRTLDQYIYFDKNQYFREQTFNKEAFIQFIEKAEHFISFPLTTEEQYFLLGAVGNSYRIINEAHQAIEYFRKCLNLIDQNPTKKIVTKIRLGEAFKYAQLYTKALIEFDEAMIISKEHQIRQYEHFIFQHKGKCYLELGEISLAKESLLLALQNRKVSNNKELILSTQQVLDYLEKSNN